MKVDTNENLMSDEADLFLMNYKNKIISFYFAEIITGVLQVGHKLI